MTRAGVIAAVSILLLAQVVSAAEKPLYGGVLRVELRASSVSLNPQRWSPGSAEFAAEERLAELVFERLVTLDRFGRFQPQLATEWTRDVAAKRWQFVLRQGVKFSDGSTLTPADVVTSLQPWLTRDGRGIQISATANGVTIRAPYGGDLLQMLSSGPLFVYKEDGGGLLGTGPFVLETRTNSASATGSTERLHFRFNENCWSGRPFLDGIDVALAVPPLKALLDLQLGTADVSELSEETARRAGGSNVRMWTSLPTTLVALQFASPAASEREETLRKALQLAVDRNAMARVLLQKQAEPVGSLLPQWLSGYAFLFDGEANLERAKQLRASLPNDTAGIGKPLRLGFDGNQELAKLIAERVAVNARAVGLTVQVSAKAKSASFAAGENPTPRPEPELQLRIWRYSSLSPATALNGLVTQWKLADGKLADAESYAPSDSDTRYAWEKRILDEGNVIPLVAIPDFAAVDSRVRNWSPEPWGEWHLADVWLDSAERVRAAERKDPGVKP